MSEPGSEKGATSLTVGQALEQAVTHHRLGQLQEAERLYREILRADPRQSDANHNLGVLVAGVGKPEAALPFLQAALHANPRQPQYWLTYINTLISAGDLAGARAALDRAEKSGLPAKTFQATRQALASSPGAGEKAGPTPQEVEALVTTFDSGRYIEAEERARKLTEKYPAHGFGWNVLGATLKLNGRPKEAASAAEQAAILMPQVAEVHSNLGIILHTLGRFDEAEKRFRRVINLEPAYKDAFNSLGGTLVALKRLAEAENCFQQGIIIKPDEAKLYHNLAAVQKELGKLEEAEKNCRRATALNPQYPEAHSNLGNILRGLGRLPDAEAEYRRALDLRPDYVEARNNLGVLLRGMGRIEEAEACYRRVLELQPGFAEAHNNLAEVLNARGNLDEATTSYRRALEVKPDYAVAHSNLLLCLNYLPQLSPGDLFAEHCQWEKQQAKSCLQVPLAPDKNPRRRLRIGYVSPDFKQHSVAYFLEPLLREHDHSEVEIFCYADVLRPDAFTKRMQALADHWLRTIGLSDHQLAEQIRADEIDILVDLAGHTADNRLLVFARKPAPVQVTWLGYPNTTGLRTIDYRLVDEVADPSGLTDAHATEHLIRLAGGFLSYAPPTTAPNPRPPPSAASGTITFGSFNYPTKLSAKTLDAWAALIKEVKGARLLLKGKLFNETINQKAFLKRLEEHAIDSSRVTLLGYSAGLEDHLSSYGQVDIALDPFPYNGTTTTCEAIWMGVPVITLAGDRHAARVGASLLTQIGLTGLITTSADAYVATAAALARDPTRLINYRHTLRGQMAVSALCSGPAFARKIEAAYRQMWQAFCSRSDYSPPTDHNAPGAKEAGA